MLPCDDPVMSIKSRLSTSDPRCIGTSDLANGHQVSLWIWHQFGAAGGISSSVTRMAGTSYDNIFLPRLMLKRTADQTCGQERSSWCSQFLTSWRLSRARPDSSERRTEGSITDTASALSTHINTPGWLCLSYNLHYTSDLKRMKFEMWEIQDPPSQCTILFRSKVHIHSTD